MVPTTRTAAAKPRRQRAATPNSSVSPVHPPTVVRILLHPPTWGTEGAVRSRTESEIEVDDHRSVVGRPLALAGLAVDVGVAHPVRERRRRVDEVYAHAHVLVEHAGPVVPIRVRGVVLHRPRHHVG